MNAQHDDPYSLNHEANYDRYVAEYQQQLARLGETQRRLGEIACTAVGPRQAVSVTVGHGGVVTNISFPTGAYKRMAPKELATLLTETINEAREQALSEATEILAPSMPAGVDTRSLLTGRIDLRSLLPEVPDVSEQTYELLAMRDRGLV